MPAVLNNRIRVLSASTLAGYRVRSIENDDLGTIEELMIDPNTGRIAYAVLCFGWAQGLGEKLFAIPWELLRLNAPDHAVVLEWDTSRLDGAPAFEADEWPDFGDESWERKIRDFYGRTTVYKS